MKITCFSLILLLNFIVSGCVDRISYDIPYPEQYPVVVDGYISDQPGPYEVFISSSYDIESKSLQRVPISVKRVELSDNFGNVEELIPVSRGFYQTRTNGIRGVVGRVYTLKVELLDDRKFESIPDTLYPTGIIDSVYFRFETAHDAKGATEHRFDIFFDASAGGNDDYQFMWKFTGTYEAQIPCCTCWAFIRNSVPLVSDGQVLADGHFSNVKAGTVPVTGWTFMNKVYAQVEQLSLSPNAYRFWKQVRDQKLAIGSLFQPVGSKIQNNFIQIGKDGVENEIYGIFYATSIATKGVYIERNDLPNLSVIPKIQLAPPSANYNPFKRPCTEFFPGSTTTRPPYWVD